MKKEAFNLESRAQITLYLILGIILFFILGFLVYMNSNRQDLDADLVTDTVIAVEHDSIKNYIESCIVQELEPLLYEMAWNGGTLRPPESEQLPYEGVDYTYQCLWQPFKGCINRLYTRTSMERELETALESPTTVQTCASFEPFEKQGFIVTSGAFNVDVTIGQDDVHVAASYPLEFEQADFRISVNEYAINALVPLGKLIDLSQSIVYDEVEQHRFNEDAWMVDHGAEISIEKHKPYPDLVYQLRTSVEGAREDLIFNFAVQGESTVDLIGLPSNPTDHQGYCVFEDSTCYPNVDETLCSGKGGQYLSPLTPPTLNKCGGLTDWSGPDCNGRECSFCTLDSGQVMEHGSSWCEYDKAVTPGFDAVGSRHYQRSCINGEIKKTECRDFREEVCVEFQSTDISTGDTLDQGICRPNRWQECAKQTDVGSCENAGDCYWSDFLVKSDGTEKTCDYTFEGWSVTGEKLYADDLSRPYETRKCHPINPPGFKFWSQQGIDVCSMANEMVDGDLEHHAQSWVDSTANYCYSLGDCGAWRNVADQLDEKGFMNSDAVQARRVTDSTFFYQGSSKSIPDYKNRVQQVGALTEDDFKPFVASGDELTDGQKSIENMMTNWMQYLQCANREFTESNIEKEIEEEICLEECTKYGKDYCCGDWSWHYWVRHVSFCMPWQAPTPGEHNRQAFSPLQRENPTPMCEFCNDDEANDKPCTEYKCRSLGTNCIFEIDDNGYGNCFAASTDDTDPPVVMLDIDSLPEGVTAEKTFLNPGDYEGEKLCVGECRNNGHFAPYTPMKFTIETPNEESKCRASLFPIDDYYEIDPFISHLFLNRVPPTQNADFGLTLGDDFSTTHEMEFTIFPMHEVYGEFADFFQSELILQLTDFDIIRSWLRSITSLGYRVLSRASEHRLAQEFNELWQTFTNYESELIEVFLDFQDSIQIVLLESQAQNVVLFFNCIDRAGNQNGDFFVKFEVGKDNYPPEIVATEPALGEEVLDSFRLQLLLNEPSECRYALDNGNLRYRDMPAANQMQCQTSYLDTTGGYYSCFADIVQTNPSFTSHNVFVRCLDHPISFTAYHLLLEQGTEFEINDVGFDAIVELSGSNTVSIKDLPSLSFDTPQIYSPDPSVQVEFWTSSEKDCRYAFEDTSTFDLAVDRFNCLPAGDRFKCSATIPVDGRVTTIKCSDPPADRPQRNEFPSSEQLTFPIKRS